MENVAVHGLGVMIELEREFRACSPSNAKPPLLVRKEGAHSIDITADTSIKRSYLVKEVRLRRYNRLVAAKGLPADQKKAETRYYIANLIFELEVWEKHPQLCGESIEMYDGWELGKKKKPPEIDKSLSGWSVRVREFFRSFRLAH